LSQKLGKRVKSHQFHENMHDVRSPVFAGHPYGIDAPESEMIFIFSETQANLKPTRSVNRLHCCMLVALKKHKLYQPAW